MTFTDIFNITIAWTNNNPGPLRVVMFLVTIILGWISGIFSALRRKPKFKVTFIQGPTFCCTYMLGRKNGEYDIHRTGIALYLRIANIGSAPSSIEDISIGYHWHLKPFSLLWLKYSVRRFWLKEQVAVLNDFQATIGENIKVYPFLFQASCFSGSHSETYLENGQSTNGVVYFEQDDSFGGSFPTIRKNNTVRIKVHVQDTFGRIHCAKFDIPSVSLEEARKYNPALGKTLAELRGEQLPFDTLSRSQAPEAMKVF
ncbi:MAG: hypothetical protein ACNA7G_11805 [Methylobacter sp.]